MATNPPIAIGELLDVPAPGSGVKSAWCQEITNRIHHRFATPAARTAAFTAPNPVAAKGQASYLTTGDATEGPEFFNGVAWRKPWNQPWGYVGSATGIANAGPMGTGDLAGMSIGPITPVAGRRWKVTASGYGGTQVGAGVSELWLADGGSARLNAVVMSRVAGDTGWGFCLVTMITTTGVATLVKLRNNQAAGTPTMTYYAGANIPMLLLVEDVGPVGVPA